MKQSCFIFLVTIFSGIATATAQPFVPYHPFVKEGKVWKCVETEEGFEDVGNATYVYELTVTFDLRIKGDTVIDGQTYKKVYRDDICEDKEMQITGIGSQGQESISKHRDIGTTRLYTEFLREEDKRVFARRANKNSEYLLYDFTLNAGNQLPGGFPNSGSMISSIDVVLAQGQYFRRFHLQPRNWGNYVLMWIEGVGHPSGLFDSVMASLNDTKIIELQSCYEDGECIFTKEDFDNLAVTAGMDDLYSPNMSDKTTNGRCYDLHGRLLRGKPSKGLYIKDGRKRIVR